MINLMHGDCLDVLRTLPDNSVDAVVTDPPYGLSFMGKKWDYDVPATEVWAECLRVLKPGGHLLAFAGTRTQHRMAVRIEDAGFEIRDMIAWLYASGFPKSHNLKGEREGWGTALKPALEPVTVARKPLSEGTVAANVLAHGTGAINVDGCRVGFTSDTDRASVTPQGKVIRNNFAPGAGLSGTETNRPDNSAGRWPANLIHDGSEEVLAGFPQANHKTGGPARTSIGGNGAYSGGDARVPVGYDDTGSAARFFYCAKASKRDRDEGLEGFEISNNMRVNGPRESEEAKHATMRANIHPTVKPTDLMRYLCRLVTPPGGTVLDPFMGSGSTGKAARLEGFQFIGIEREAEYLEIARARINAVQVNLL